MGGEGGGARLSVVSHCKKLRSVCCQAFKDELAVVLRRQEWLRAIKDSDSSKVKELLQQAMDPSDDAASQAGSASRDLSSLAKAGPCAGFSELKTCKDLEQMAIRFRACGSKEDLKDVTDSITPSKKLWGTLLSSCKASVSELRGAKSRSDEAEKKRRAKEEEVAASAKKAAAGKRKRDKAASASKSSDPAIFGLEAEHCDELESSSSWRPDWLLAGKKPFLVTSVAFAAETDKFDSFLKDFAKAFNESSLKASFLFV